MKQNQWEVWHDTNWTEFETHSLIFGILRKHCKGNYIVRGEYCFLTADGYQFRPDISIFELVEKGKPAQLKLIIEVKKEGNNLDTFLQTSKYSLLGVPVIVVTGKEGSNILPLVSPYLPKI